MCNMAVFHSVVFEICRGNQVDLPKKAQLGPLEVLCVHLKTIGQVDLKIETANEKKRYRIGRNPIP